MNAVRTKWTQEHIQQLQVIYEQEAKRGYKKLWVRISERVNATVRTAKRQAIEYKWKNLNNITSHKQIRLCKDENLIELIFDLVPSEGYHGLVHHESFAGVTEANIKNIFYSNIRSISKFLHGLDEIKESKQEILKMLGNHILSRFITQIFKEYSCLHIELVHEMKYQMKMIKVKVSSSCSMTIEEKYTQILIFYGRMRSIYLNNVLDLEKGGALTTEDNISEHSPKSQNIQLCKQEWETKDLKPKSLLFIEDSYKCNEMDEQGVQLFGELGWNGNDFIY